jgi:hypothetical protein
MTSCKTTLPEEGIVETAHQWRNRSMKSASTTYTRPMHPEVKQDSSGNCPKCGMKVVPAAEKSRHRSKDRCFRGT